MEGLTRKDAMIRCRRNINLLDTQIKLLDEKAKDGLSREERKELRELMCDKLYETERLFDLAEEEYAETKASLGIKPD